MSSIWKASEWQDSSGWKCNCVDNLGAGSALWYLPARILGITPAAYIELMINKYNAKFYYDKDKVLIFFYWEKQSDMRLYKNFINAEARKKNFQI